MFVAEVTLVLLTQFPAGGCISLKEPTNILISITCDLLIENKLTLIQDPGKYKSIHDILLLESSAYAFINLVRIDSSELLNKFLLLFKD